MTYYDDNYGDWSEFEYDNDPDDVEAFRNHVEQNSVWKVCSVCGRNVHIQRHYDKCDSCCRKIERGYQW